jgi:phosphate transport system substrate-binding protein
MVSRSPGSIGYVESSFAVINRLPVAQLQNRAGNFVQPTAANVIAAALNAEFTPANGFVPNLLNQAGDQTWPIVGATYLLIPTNAANPDRSRRVVEFVNWAFEHGDASAARLHYVPLPATVKHQLLQTLRDRLQIN